MGVKKNRLLAITAWISLGCFAVFGLFSNRADPDLWGHVLFGEEILDTGSVPKTDPYSYTARGGRWINHEWLSEVLFALAWRLGGSAGLMGLKVLVGGLAMILIALAGREEAEAGHPALFLCLFASFSMLSYGLALRPQVFSFLLLAATLLILKRSERKGTAILLTLPPLFALWANLHGGFAAGLAVLGVFCLFSSIPGSKRLLLFLLCLLATLINPYGFGLLRFLAATLTRPRPSLAEWEPVGWSLSHTDFKASLLLTSLCLLGVKRRRTWEAVTLLALGAAALLQNRHIPIFGVALGALLPPYLSATAGARVPNLLRLSRKRFFRAAAAILLLLLCPFFLLKTRERYPRTPFAIGMAEGEYPVEEVRFLKESGISGNLLPFFNWGEYCIWHLRPRCPVGIDGRYRTVYPEEVIAAYNRFVYAGDGWRDFLNRYPTEILLLHRHNPVTPLLKEGRAEGWLLAWEGPVGCVFLKRKKASDSTPEDASYARGVPCVFP